MIRVGRWSAALQAVRDFGGDPNGGNVEPIKNGGYRYKGEGDTEIMWRPKGDTGPTLEIHLPKTKDHSSVYKIKKRYGP